MPLRLELLVFCCALLPGAEEGLSQQFTVISFPDLYQGCGCYPTFGSVRSSADGSVLAAVSYNNTYSVFSLDAGNTWTRFQSMPGWTGGGFGPAVAVSADGRFIATGDEKGISVLNVSLGSWVRDSNTYGANWESIACSADGRIMVAAAELDVAYISTSWGTNWLRLGFMPLRTWVSIACSADGTKVALAGFNAPTYISTNSAATWYPANAATNCWLVNMSADGSKVTASGPNTNAFFTSTDYGVTWTTNYMLQPTVHLISSSPDGTALAGTDSTNLWRSTDSGATWTNFGPVAKYRGCTLSADGNVLAGQRNDTNIWIARYTPMPRLAIAPRNTNVQLSWTVPSAPFVLQGNTDITTTNWVTLTNLPSLNLSNLHNQVSLPQIGNQGFYRLRTP